MYAAPHINHKYHGDNPKTSKQTWILLFRKLLAWVANADLYILITGLYDCQQENYSDGDCPKKHYEEIFLWYNDNAGYPERKEIQFMCPDEIDFLPLGMDDDERSFYDENKVNINMQIGMIEREAQERAKLDHCYYCNEPATSFCNSHSVPKFCLRRIAVDGQLFFANTLIDLPYLKEEQGVNKAG